MLRKCYATDSGVTLVELMISVLIASILMLMVYSVFISGSKVTRENRDTMICMQSIRSAVLQIDRDLMQGSYLLPQDLKVVCRTGELFVAGLPLTAGNNGLSLVTDDGASPPPYFAVVQQTQACGLILDDPNIDKKTGDSAGNADFVANLGIITENGAYIISNNYTRGNTLLKLTSNPTGVSAGDRVVPAVHYELKTDGLYRNGEILAENIVAFETIRQAGTLTINLSAAIHGETRDLQYKIPLG